MLKYIKVSDYIKIDRRIDTDEIYFVFFPPGNSEEIRDRKIDIWEKISDADKRKLRHMLQLADRGAKNKFFEYLNTLGWDKFIIYNISPMHGKDLIKFCEKYQHVPMFDIMPKDVQRFVRAYGLQHHEKRLRRAVNAQTKPSEFCCMLVPLFVYIGLLENSMLNKETG